VPALVVAGELDQPDFPLIARRLSELIPGAQLKLLPNVSHLPPMEAPAEFSRLVLDFLGR
jgi:pimeloyl-ACP methyl ester carboxylesterase